jgi:hypothetical protein
MVREVEKDGVDQGLGRRWITPRSLVGVAVGCSSSDDKAIATAFRVPWSRLEFRESRFFEQLVQHPLGH